MTGTWIPAWKAGWMYFSIRINAFWLFGQDIQNGTGKRPDSVSFP